MQRHQRSTDGRRAASLELAGVPADLAAAVSAVVVDPDAHGAVVVKATPKRRVVRVESAVGPLIVKHFRATNAVDRARASRRAESEFETAKALRARGFPAPEPIAVGPLPDGGGTAYAARAVEDAVPLGGFLEAQFKPGDGRADDKREPLARAVDLLGRMHSATFDHRDYHGGNLLVSRGELVVIDLHRVVRGRPIPNHRRVASLADLLHTLRFAIDAEDVEYAVRRYLGSAGFDVAITPKWTERVRRAIARREAARVKSRTRRCVEESSRFTRVRAGGVRGWRRRECTEADVFAAVAAARAAFASGGVAVRSLARRSSVALAEAGGRHVAVKLYERDGKRRSLRGKLTRGRAGRAYVAAHGLEVRGVPVPKVVAWLRAPDRAFLVVDAVADAMPLSAASFRIAPGGDLAARADEVAAAVGVLLETLAASGARVNDLSPKNVLLAVGTTVGANLCDFDGVRLGRPATRDEWIDALAQLNDLAPGVPVRARLAVLRRVKRAVPELRGVRVARSIEKKTAKRRAKRLDPSATHASGTAGRR